MRLGLEMDLAELAAREIKGELAFAHRLVAVAVLNGWVTLEGDVDWNYQRNGAETAVRGIPWVKGITNALHVQPHAQAAEVDQKIEAAFRAHGSPGNGARLRAWAA